MYHRLLGSRGSTISCTTFGLVPGCWKRFCNQNQASPNSSIHQFSRQQFDFLEQKLGIDSPKKWFKVTYKQLNGDPEGNLALTVHKTIPKLLSVYYPSHEWHPWLFPILPRGYWAYEAHQREYLLWLKDVLKYNELDDFHQLSVFQLTRYHGRGLYEFYGASIVAMLRGVFPHHVWLEWKFPNVPKNYWQSSISRRRYLEWLGRELNMKLPSDWYRLTQGMIRSKYGSGYLSIYNGSVSKALIDTFPEYNWQQWFFNSIPKHFWKSISNQKYETLTSFCSVGAYYVTLSLHTPQDWLNLNQEDFKRNHGLMLLREYNYSPAMTICALRPDLGLKIFQFKRTPQEWWNNINNQRSYLEWAKQQLNINQPEDWYSVTFDRIVNLHGATLLSKYNNHLYYILAFHYDFYDWRPYLFPNTPKSFWEAAEPGIIRKYVNDVEQKLHIETPDDWYRISQRQFTQFGGEGLLSRFGSIYKVLSIVYPDQVWSAEKFNMSGAKKSSQRTLYVILKSLFPHEDIYEDYLHPQLVFQSTNSSMQLDLFIPSLKLAFEYHGIHHYRDTMLFGLSKQYQDRDAEKRESCDKFGLTLIEVAYWSNLTPKFIVTEITRVRPELLINLNANNDNRSEER